MLCHYMIIVTFPRPLPFFKSAHLLKPQGQENQVQQCVCLCVRDSGRVCVRVRFSFHWWTPVKKSPLWCHKMYCLFLCRPIQPVVGCTFLSHWSNKAHMECLMRIFWQKRCRKNKEKEERQAVCGSFLNFLLLLNGTFFWHTSLFWRGVLRKTFLRGGGICSASNEASVLTVGYKQKAKLAVPWKSREVSSDHYGPFKPK